MFLIPTNGYSLILTAQPIFVKSKEILIRTFEILPEYLKTQATSITNNYRDWGIPLGRRFRALKLWFVIRDYGVNGLQEKIREHIGMTQNLTEKIRSSSDFELLVEPPLNLILFSLQSPKKEILRKN